MNATMRKIPVTTLMLALLWCMVLTLTGCARTGPSLADLTPPPGYPEGAYVDVYDSTGFSGSSARFWGPAIFNDLTTTKGASWAGKIRSLSVGPEAHVKITDQSNLTGNVLWLTPGQKVEDLAKLGLQGKAASLEIVAQEKKD